MRTDATTSDAQAPRAEWLSQRERGTVLCIRAAFRVATLFGRRATRPLVSMIAMWYRVFDRSTVAASRAWLRRVHGREPGFWAVWRHVRTFAQVTMDKVFLVTGRTGALRFTRNGSHLLEEQLASGKGAMLLGAHLGSYEALRQSSEEQQFPVEILGHFANARMINSLLQELNPRQAASVIHIGDDPIGVMSRVQGAIEKGHLVASLADRTGLNANVATARFFGEDANFASGPFLMAAVLRCPVYLVFGLYREPNHYDLYCEPFADRIELPRRDREKALQAWVQRYADRLEHYCREAPDNWFNFFDFWARTRPANRP